MNKIFVNGSFDLLHRGHIELLNYAKSLKGLVTVAIDSDRRIKELKGDDRPIVNQRDREYHLLNLRSVDWVCVFDSDEELIDIIKTCSPDVMVKGSDYRNKPIIGQEFCKEIVFYDRTEHSTTKTIQDISNRR